MKGVFSWFKHTNYRGRKLINCLAISRLAIGDCSTSAHSATFSGCCGWQHNSNNTFAAQSNWRKTNWWKIKFSHRNVAQIEMQSGQSGLLKNFMIAFCTHPSPQTPKTSHRGLNAKPPPVHMFVCVCDTCATGRAYLWVLLQNVCQKGQELLCRAMSRPVPQLSLVSQGRQKKLLASVVTMYSYVCSATLAIKYKYAIKQTRTGRAYALLQWPAVGGDIC